MFLLVIIILLFIFFIEVKYLHTTLIIHCKTRVKLLLIKYLYIYKRDHKDTKIVFNSASASLAISSCTTRFRGIIVKYITKQVRNILVGN